MKSGVNSHKLKDNPHKGLILAYNHLLNVELGLIRKYIPDNGLVRSHSCFKALMVLSLYPISTNAFVQLKTGNKMIGKTLAYLLSLGYVDKVGKPRLIIPFQAYKVDKAYKLTALGESVLNSILSSLAQTA